MGKSSNISFRYRRISPTGQVLGGGISAMNVPREVDYFEAVDIVQRKYPNYQISDVKVTLR